MSAITLDACLGTDEPNTHDLARMMRHTFDGPIIASSGSADFRRELMDAGCDRECDKFELAKYLRKLLHLK